MARWCALGLLVLVACGPDVEEGDEVALGESGDGAPTCESMELPVCEQTDCLQRWSMTCDQCGCYEPSLECRRQFSGMCELPSPCPRVWRDYVDEREGATCVLEHLRDGGAGEFSVSWGPGDDDSPVGSIIESRGDGTVMVQWGSNDSVYFRSGVLPLRDTEWFDECLAGDIDAQLDCLIGDGGSGGLAPPSDWAPPYVVPECVAVEPTCL